MDPITTARRGDPGDDRPGTVTQTATGSGNAIAYGGNVIVHHYSAVLPTVGPSELAPPVNGRVRITRFFRLGPLLGHWKIVLSAMILSSIMAWFLWSWVTVSDALVPGFGLAFPSRNRLDGDVAVATTPTETALRPGPAPAFSSQDFVEKLASARALLHIGKYAEACRAFEGSLRNPPPEAAAIDSEEIAMARSEYEQNNFQESARHFEKALSNVEGRQP